MEIDDDSVFKMNVHVKDHPEIKFELIFDYDNSTTDEKLEELRKRVRRFSTL